MTIDHKHPVTCPAVDRAIRFEAFRAAGSLHRFGYDYADIRQEMRLHFLTQFAHFDGRASVATFAAHVCRNRALRLLDVATSLKRDRGGAPRSLSDSVSLGDDRGVVELSTTISEEAYAMRTGRRYRTAAELLILRLDVRRIMKILPAELAAVAELLAEGETPTAAASRLGIARSTIHRRIVRLRGIFHQAGLGLYIGEKEAA
jgi:RNA polymerase sigma factor (sigma-70 family)